MAINHTPQVCDNGTGTYIIVCGIDLFHHDQCGCHQAGQWPEQEEEEEVERMCRGASQAESCEKEHGTKE